LKDEFIANVSHELRTPLNHMLGWVLLLRERQLAPAQTTEALEIIERNVRAQNSLIEDLLDTTRVLTGQLRCESLPVELSRIVTQAVAAAQSQAVQKNIRLQSDCAPGECYVLGDAERLQQIVANLLSNAVKFTPPRGHVEVTLRTNGARAELTVRDTGCGIAPEFLPHVFDRFRQQDGARARRAGGLGLGLSIVKHLVELHGGTITVASSGINQGASFAVTLPLLTAGQVSEASQKEENHPLFSNSPFSLVTLPLSGLRVLAVDDEADTLALLAAVLIPAGAELRQATTAAQAIALWRNWQPDVLVSDIGMPEMDGHELIRRVRAAEREMKQRSCPAIALTAYANVEERLRALAAGYHMHLAKPVEPAELVTVIASLTGRLAAKDNC
ncbi:MAG TPA: hybrid sensor histidine kinase/response regulator, partial [Blastocatellia bacterium]|nr:hybrid sensor histidine kinase/response regulator [Blastocatellia bacterium]